MLTSARAALDAIDPRLWFLAVAVASFALIQAWKKLHARSFRKVPKRLRALPALLVAALVGAASAAELQQILIEGLIGAAAGLMAVGSQETGRRLKTGKGHESEGQKA